jgi:hypothetical protein
MIRWTVAAVLTAMLLCGCAGKPGASWYKEGFGQAAFDRDVQECRLLAEEFGRQATLNGRRVDLETQAKAHNQCLFAKGWSHVPPQTRGSEHTEPSLVPVTVDQNMIDAFDKSIRLPEGFALKGRSEQIHGPMASHILSFQGPGPVFLNMVFQQSSRLNFEQVPYPVDEPFLLYDRGSMGTGVDWSAFSSSIKGQWVAGIGAYLLHSDRQRTTVVLTSVLPPRDDLPPPGLTLDLRQHQAMEEFMARWLPWLEEAGRRQ